MRKLVILIVLMVLSITKNFAQTPMEVTLDVEIFDPTGSDGNTHKSPVVIPLISIDDHTLYFDTPCDGCTLNIVDENDVVVYTLVIPSGTTSLVLPSTLFGEYELQIINGNYLFYGKIDLP